MKGKRFTDEQIAYALRSLDLILMVIWSFSSVSSSCCLSLISANTVIGRFRAAASRIRARPRMTPIDSRRFNRRQHGVCDRLTFRGRERPFH